MFLSVVSPVFLSGKGIDGLCCLPSWQEPDAPVRNPWGIIEFSALQGYLSLLFTERSPLALRGPKLPYTELTCLAPRIYELINHRMHLGGTSWLLTKGHISALQRAIPQHLGWSSVCVCGCLSPFCVLVDPQSWSTSDTEWSCPALLVTEPLSEEWSASLLILGCDGSLLRVISSFT